MTKTITPKKSPARTAVNKVKTAPQKLMEHTVDTALKSVEKAAVKQAVRTEKKTKKKIAKAIKKAERTAVKKTTKATMARRTAKQIKEKIKNIIHPAKEEVFYYSRTQLILLVLFYALVAGIVYYIANCFYAKCLATNTVLSVVLILTMGLTLAALASAVFVMMFPQKLAVVTSKQIKIDHNAPLLWRDVQLAEEKYSSCVSHRPFIALHLKEGVSYPLTFMQKLCKNNIFTPFSLPLYAMKKKDADKLRKLVKRYAHYENNLKK